MLFTSTNTSTITSTNTSTNKNTIQVQIQLQIQVKYGVSGAEDRKYLNLMLKPLLIPAGCHASLLTARVPEFQNSRIPVQILQNFTFKLEEILKSEVQIQILCCQNLTQQIIDKY